MRDRILRRRSLVLMYHGFCEEPRTDDPENLFVAVRDLQRQLDHLLRHGWQPLDLDGFLAASAQRSTKKTFLLTIDDGLESVARLAAPVLESRSVPSVLFVPAGLVGAVADWLPQPPDQRLLDREELRALVRGGRVEVGGHGYEHVDLRGLEDRELVRQTALACTSLQEVTGSPVRAFAYPFGFHDRAARTAVATSGCLVGFSVFEDDGPFAVSRVDVNATDTLWSFRVKLVPGYRTWWQTLGRVTLLRRVVRRVVARRPPTRGRGGREAA